jgi:hypothetical protein
MIMNFSSKSRLQRPPALQRHGEVDHVGKENASIPRISTR